MASSVPSFPFKVLVLRPAPKRRSNLSGAAKVMKNSAAGNSHRLTALQIRLMSSNGTLRALIPSQRYLTSYVAEYAQWYRKFRGS